MNMRTYMAEALGTALLVIGGCGAAIFAGGSYGVIGISIAFGASLALVAYIIGPISGGHVNPAVTLTLALAGKFPWKKFGPYVVAQIVGGLIGGGILYLIASHITGFDVVKSGFAANTLNPGVSTISAILVEVVMSFILCLAVLSTTRQGFPSASTPLTVGAALMLVHLVSIPFTNTSVNPARTLAVAYYVPETWSHLWIFMVSPLLGAVLAYMVYRLIFEQAPKPAQVADAVV